MSDKLIPTERRNGMVTVSSIEVAKDFHKDHKHVIESIGKIEASFQSAQKSADYSEYKDIKNYFVPDTYTDRRNRKQPMYQMTRDGFQLLAMGFTGEAALQWKLKYIETFDKMENAIRQAVAIPQQPTALDALKQTVAVLDGLTQKVTALEDKQSKLEQAVANVSKPVDWKAEIKSRVEGVTGKTFRHSGLFLAGMYSNLESNENVRLGSRLNRQRKKMKTRGATANELRNLSKLDIIAQDECLKAKFETMLDRVEM